jgi:hypothetical protein
MDRVISEFSQNSNRPAEAADIAFVELSDLQLAIVGGGCGETIL